MSDDNGSEQAEQAPASGSVPLNLRSTVRRHNTSGPGLVEVAYLLPFYQHMFIAPSDVLRQFAEQLLETCEKSEQEPSKLEVARALPDDLPPPMKLR